LQQNPVKEQIEEFDKQFNTIHESTYMDIDIDFEAKIMLTPVVISEEI
jgi:hypothetical protein